MGYRIYYSKNNATYSVLEENDPDYVLVSALYHRQKRTVGTLTFSLLDNHPSYDVFEKFKGIIYLDFNDVRLFTARIYNVKKNQNNSKTVECESLIAYLNDSVIAPYTFNRANRIFVNAGVRPPGGYPITAKDFITDLLSEHNSQVNEEQRVFLNPSSSEILNTEISTQGSGYTSAWDELSSKILNNYGGDIDLDLTQSDTKINFIDSPSQNISQEIRYGVNLRSLEVSYNDVFATAVRPYSTYIDENGESQTIDIASVNGGSYFIVKQSAANVYGRINRAVEIKGATNPTDLYNLSLSKLNEMSKLRIITNLTVLDMYALDDSVMPIKAGQLIRAVSEPNDVNFTAEVTAFDADILNPGNSVFTIDGEKPALTQILKNTI